MSPFSSLFDAYQATKAVLPEEGSKGRYLWSNGEVLLQYNPHEDALRLDMGSGNASETALFSYDGVDALMTHVVRGEQYFIDKYVLPRIIRPSVIEDIAKGFSPSSDHQAVFFRKQGLESVPGTLKTLIDYDSLAARIMRREG